MSGAPKPGLSAAPAAAQAPALTLPPAEAEALGAAYGAAEVILEYGSGGSTALAAAMPGKRIFSVESDAAWAAGLGAWFAANPGASPVTLHHADIGPTKDWGHPVNAAAFRRWPLYALSVWDREDFVHPDVVFVDGRFRAACFLTTLFRITRPVTLLWDDYADRPAYHEMEDFAPRTGLIGRMAIFDLTPAAIPADRLGQILQTYLRPL